MANETWTASSQLATEMLTRVTALLPQLLGALVLVLVGWFVASLLRRLTSRALARVQRRVVGRAEIESGDMDRLASRAVGGIVFWLVLVLFLAAAGELLGLEVVTTGLGRLVQYLPNVLGAVLVILAGLILANLARPALIKAATTAGIGYSATLGQAARVVILLLAGVIAMDQIGIDSELLIASTNILVASVLGGAALAFALGSRGAVSNILALHYVMQTYRLGDRIRVGDLEGEIVQFTKTGVVVECPSGRVLVPAQEFSEQRSTLVGETRS